jgi:hypothetical protein
MASSAEGAARDGSGSAITAAAPTLSDAKSRQTGRSWSMGVVSRVTDLVQIAVTNAHVRVECEYLDAAGARVRPPFSLGVVLHSLTINSTDVAGSTVGAVRSGDNLSFIRKRASLQGLAIYCDSGDGYRVDITDRARLAADMMALAARPADGAAVADAGRGGGAGAAPAMSAPLRSSLSAAALRVSSHDGIGGVALQGEGGSSTTVTARRRRKRA